MIQYMNRQSYERPGRNMKVKLDLCNFTIKFEWKEGTRKLNKTNNLDVYKIKKFLADLNKVSNVVDKDDVKNCV